MCRRAGTTIGQEKLENSAEARPRDDGGAANSTFFDEREGKGAPLCAGSGMARTKRGARKEEKSRMSSART